jgi:hypothetical protein
MSGEPAAEAALSIVRLIASIRSEHVRGTTRRTRAKFPDGHLPDAQPVTSENHSTVRTALFSLKHRILLAFVRASAPRSDTKPQVSALKASLRIASR